MELFEIKGEFIWKIKNFLILPQNGEFLESNVVTLLRGDKVTKWKLKIFPMGEEVEPSDEDEKEESSSVNVGLFLYNLSGAPEKASFKFGIIDRDKMIRKACTVPFHVFPDGFRGWGYPSFITRDVLKRDKHVLLSDGTLTIYFSIEPIDVEHDFKLRPPSSYSSLNRVCKRLFQREESADIKIIVGDGDDVKEFKVHRSVLTEQSSVFDAMFANNMQEAQAKTVNITDFSDDIVGDFINFLYTNDVEDIDKKDKELLPIADKYNVDMLKILIQQSLCKKITVKTVADLVEIAEKYNCVDMKKECIQYIHDNGKDVVKTRGWKQLEKNGNNISIVSAVMKKLLNAE